MKSKLLDIFSLKGMVAVITGTTRGLGQSLAEGLAEAGATVVALDRSDNNYLPKYCASLGVKFSRKQIDLQKASRDALTHSIDTIVNEFSRIDILVNNAGITRRGVPETMNEQDWCEVLDMNLTVPFYLSQAAAKHFIEQKSGKIINIASVLSFQGGINVPSYTASKHGLIGLTRSFAIRLARYGINVNAIAPGFMETDMNVPLIHDRERNVQILHRIPAGRWGQGRDLKGALILLASKASEFINGAIIPVDGGWLAG